MNDTNLTSGENMKIKFNLSDDWALQTLANDANLKE